MRNFVTPTCNTCDKNDCGVCIINCAVQCSEAECQAVKNVAVRDMVYYGVVGCSMVWHGMVW
jgi:hypothetical protein